ncbi:SDR family NAD(P)-dependent oxidoreductase, partial [Escherichia coli]|nr:SDR family NAD(P)-dependent oxidoreductase [Escherichia coli]
MPEKVVIITGASSGIGRASALIFARNGWTVIASGRNENELQ